MQFRYFNPKFTDYILKCNIRFTEENFNHSQALYKCLLHNLHSLNLNDVHKFKFSFCLDNNIKSRDTDTLIDSNNLLTSLMLLCINKPGSIFTSAKDLDNFFERFNCLEINNELLKNILQDFMHLIDKINFLRECERNFLENKIFTLVIEGFTKFIRDFLYLHDYCISLLLQIINYQQEKSFFNAIFINEPILNSSFVEDFYRRYVDKIKLYKNCKLTLMSKHLVVKQKV